MPPKRNKYITDLGMKIEPSSLLYINSHPSLLLSPITLYFPGRVLAFRKSSLASVQEDVFQRGLVQFKVEAESLPSRTQE